jgi:hypothetical protein
MKFSLIAFPSLLLPVVFYSVAALLGGGGERFVASLNGAALGLRMPSGMMWSLSRGDLYILFGLGTLFVDLLKATGSGTANVLNHGVSMGVFILCLVLFLLVPAFVSSPFFILMMISLLDVVAGFTITIIAARRDVSFED